MVKYKGPDESRRFKSRVLANVNSFLTQTILSIVSDMSHMFSQRTKVSIFLLILMLEFGIFYTCIKI